ncbi:MAG: type III pantothenate kinase [Acidimicrobiia bacterium]|nr:type III pantothenate kinase [Acidimicrobiia bacterium]MDH3398003.1 type III pantothenate kinase [Acidimicrobiia bacterium]
MLLTIDLGNTQTVVGLFDGVELAHHWRLSTVRERTADEYRLLLHGLFEQDGVDPERFEGAVISSVVPRATSALSDALRYFVIDGTLVIGPGVKTGMPILIDNPREVGADRIVNAVAARTRYGTPVIVVDFGTSTNFDIVGEDGGYLGGVIGPGLEVSMDALVAATAALRRVELTPPRSVIGKGTVEAIQAGLLYGHAGYVDGIVDRIRAELGNEVRTVATGGLASTIVPHCRTVATVDENLTLDGLRLLFVINKV